MSRPAPPRTFSPIPPSEVSSPVSVRRRLREGDENAPSQLSEKDESHPRLDDREPFYREIRIGNEAQGPSGEEVALKPGAPTRRGFDKPTRETQ